jgi:hypothetical protein
VRFELKRLDGRTVVWEGWDGMDAAVRYVDSERVAGRYDAEATPIVAWRRPAACGLSSLGRGTIVG